MDDHYISTTTLSALGHGFLDDGAAYDVVLLTQAEASVAAAFHAAATDGLNTGEKTFLLPKSRAAFEKHLARGQGNTIISIVRKNQLIAQALVRHPTPDDATDGMVDMRLPLIPTEESVLQAVAVLPPFRRQGLPARLIDCWLDHAECQGRTQLVAEIDVANPASWGNFLKGGLNLVGIGVDPADGVQVYNAYATLDGARHKRLATRFNAAAKPGSLSCPASDLEQQKELFNAGYVCTGYKKEPSALIFQKSEL